MVERSSSSTTELLKPVAVGPSVVVLVVAAWMTYGVADEFVLPVAVIEISAVQQVFPVVVALDTPVIASRLRLPFYQHVLLSSKSSPSDTTTDVE